MHAIDFRAWGAAGTGASDPIWMIYRCPNIRTQEANGADKDCAAPTSAAGLQQGTLALEQAMDELACQLQMDPLELRCKNFADHPFLPLEKMCQLGAGGIGWDARRRGNTAGAATVRRGVGMAVSAWPSAGVSFAQAMVRIYPDGRVEVVTGAQDLGTGTGTALGMIAAEELGVPLEKVKISLGDTACGLAAPPSRRPICSCARRLPRPAGSTGIDAPGKACGHKGSCLRHRCATRQFRQARSTARDIRLDSDWRQGIVRDEGWAMNLSWRGKGWRKPHDSVCAMRRSVCRARERLRFSDRFAGLAYELSNGYGAPPRVAEGLVPRRDHRCFMGAHGVARLRNPASGLLYLAG